MWPVDGAPKFHNKKVNKFNGNFFILMFFLGPSKISVFKKLKGS